MTSAVAQRAGVLAVTETLDLPDDLMKEITSLFELAKGLARERARIIHCLWAISDDYPEGIVNCTIKSWVLLNTATHDMTLFSDETLEGLGKKLDKVNVSHLEMWLYHQHDFVDLMRRITAASTRLVKVMQRLKPERDEFVLTRLRAQRERETPPPSES
jgi:hypothetical protein